MRTYGGRTSKGIREITMRRYRTVIEREAVPLLGTLQITDIEPRDISASPSRSPTAASRRIRSACTWRRCARCSRLPSRTG